MSIVDASGVRVEGRGDKKPDVKMTQDLLLIGLRARKVSIRDIGRIFKVSHVTILRRWKAIPEDAKQHYTRSLE